MLYKEDTKRSWQKTQDGPDILPEMPRVLTQKSHADAIKDFRSPRDSAKLLQP
jgi:hypothetical protein